MEDAATASPESARPAIAGTGPRLQLRAPAGAAFSTARAAPPARPVRGAGEQRPRIQANALHPARVQQAVERTPLLATPEERRGAPPPPARGQRSNPAMRPVRPAASGRSWPVVAATTARRAPNDTSSSRKACVACSCSRRLPSWLRSRGSLAQQQQKAPRRPRGWCRMRKRRRAQSPCCFCKCSQRSCASMVRSAVRRASRRSRPISSPVSTQ